MQEIYFRYNPWWEEDFQSSIYIVRQKYLQILQREVALDSITLITGLRRVGKTTLMKILINNLIESKQINPKHLFYVSLDDYLLREKSIIEIIEDFRAINRIPFHQKIYLFFDEVTYKEDFELQLKNIFDNQNVKIFASSSSASILKSKKPFITGRANIVEILSLNFDEYLLFKNIQISKLDSNLRDVYFEDYMQTGGIPQYVLTGNIEYIKELIDDILKKDIASFYNIKNVEILKDLFLLLMERSGKQISINKIANILSISVDSAKRYLNMFEDTFLIYSIKRYGKTNTRILSPNKIYACDLGIRTIFNGFRDKGAIFENYVYLMIKKMNPVYVYENTIEIDFFTQDKRLIEVKYQSEMNEKQQKLFESFKAKEKILIKNLDDLNNLIAVLQ